MTKRHRSRWAGLSSRPQLSNSFSSWWTRVGVAHRPAWRVSQGGEGFGHGTPRDITGCAAPGAIASRGVETKARPARVGRLPVRPSRVTLPLERAAAGTAPQREGRRGTHPYRLPDPGCPSAWRSRCHSQCARRSAWPASVDPSGRLADGRSPAPLECGTERSPPPPRFRKRRESHCPSSAQW
jgi:hypothetical protein